MIGHPVRVDYERWLDHCRQAANANDAPASLPFSGYVVWFFEHNEYLDMHFDHQAFEIVSTLVTASEQAFIFDNYETAFGHAESTSRPCVILHAAGEGQPVTVVG